MAHHEKFREVLFQASPCLGLLHFLVLSFYVLAQVADPEQTNSLWSTNWLTGEGGTLPFSCPYPALTLPAQASGMWLWHTAVPLGICSRTHLYSQFPFSQQASLALRCCKLGRWSASVVNDPLCSSGSRREWVAVLLQPADSALVSWLKSWTEQG